LTNLGKSFYDLYSGFVLSSHQNLRCLNHLVFICRSKKTALDTEITMKKQLIHENQKSVEAFKTRLRTIDRSNETLVELSEDEQRCIEQIDAIEKSGVLDRCKTDISVLEKEIKNFEKEIVELTRTVDLLTDDKAITDQINSFNRQKNQKQSECNDIMRRIEDDLKSVLGAIPETRLGQTLEKKRESLAKELNQKKSELKTRDRELTVNETEMKRVRSDLEKKERRLDVAKERVDELVDNQDYEVLYEKVSETLEKRQKESYYSEAARYLYKKYIQKLNKKDCCPLCNRDMENRQKAQQLIKDIETEVEKMQQNEPREKAEVEKLRKQQQDLIEVKPFWDEKTKLINEEIPSLKTKKTALEEKNVELKDVIENLNETIDVLSADKSIADKCVTDVVLFESSKKDIKKYEDQVEKLECSRDPKAKGQGISINSHEIVNKLCE
jgi:DNA repair exonuclease SbcCD ATPase subunit